MGWRNGMAMAAAVVAAIMATIMAGGPADGQKLAVSHTPGHATGEYWLTYTVSVAGLPIAEADMIVAFGEADYNGLLDIRTVGLADAVAKWTFRAESAGRRGPGTLIPNEHITRSVRRDRARQVEIFYNGAGPERIEADPPIREKSNRAPLTDDMLPGTVDLVTALLAILTADGIGGPCRPPTKVFDGRHRFDLVTEPIGAQNIARGPFRGRAVGCRLRIEPIAGFRIDDNNFNFDRVYDAWFADVLDVGVNMIVGVESDLAFGRASIRLTEVRDFEGRVLAR